MHKECSLMPSHARRAPRGNRRTTLATVVAIGGLILTAGGVYAGLNAVATNTTPQTVTSGTLKLTMADNGAGFSQNISDMAPGDVVNRFVDLTNGGTLDAQNLTLTMADGTPTKLTTDATNGLHVSVLACTTAAWVVNSSTNTATCADVGGATTVVNNAALATIGSTPASLVAGAVAKNAVYHYEVSLTLPNQSETTTNGALPSGTIQGLSASLTWTFNELQRTATTTNS
jgi:spore coat-associated protein N